MQHGKSLNTLEEREDKRTNLPRTKQFEQLIEINSAWYEFQDFIRKDDELSDEVLKTAVSNLIKSLSKIVSVTDFCD